MTIFHVTIWVLCITILIFKINGVHSDDHEYKLINDLLRNYNSFARPSINHNDTTNVTFGLSLSQLIDVDEKNQIITTNCWLTMFWLDPKLTWNESEYGGINEIRLPHDQIWKPDVILYNNADALASLSQISTHMMITSNGNVTWLSTVIFRSSCSINVRYYPFDIQNCSLLFASWTYDGSKLNLMKNSDTGDVSNYVRNGEWILEELLVERTEKIYSCCPNPYPDVTYYIVLRRRPLFYIFNMILPCMVITAVALLGFLVPAESGEKVSIGVTTLLSMTVFLMVIVENMPPNSDNLPMIGIFYGAAMVLISLATAATVFTLNIHFKSDEGKFVPHFMQHLFFNIIAKIVFLRTSPLVVPIQKPEQKNHCIPNGASTDTVTQKSPTIYKPVVTSSKRFQYELSDSDYSPITKRLIKQQQANSLLLRPISNEQLNFSQRSDNEEYKFKNIKVSHTENSLKLSDHNSNNNSRKPEPKSKLYNEKLRRDIKLTQQYANDANYSTLHHRSLTSQERNKHFSKLMQRLNNNLEKNEHMLSDQELKELMRTQWSQLAKIIDRLLLYVFVIITLIVLASIFNQGPNT